MKMMNKIGAGMSTSARASFRRTTSRTAPITEATAGAHPRPQVNVHR
jgi:hypothetical protein